MANNNFLKLNDSVETIVIEDKIFFVDYDHGKVSYILHNNQEKNYKELLGSIDNDTISMLTQSGFIASNEEPKIVLNREHILRDFANKSDLLHYILLPSEDCNFRCTYCYETLKKLAMDKNIISAIKKNIKLRAEKYKGIFIDWFGGEPLLEIPTILEISNYAKTIAAEENKEYYSHITTNGYFLTVGNVRDLIAAGVRHFTVTIDGTSKSHDKTRVLPDGGGTFNTIFSNITQLKETDIDFNIKFRCNLNNQNYEGIKELIYIIGNLASDDPRFSDINIRTVANYNDVLDDKQTLLDRKESGKQVYELLYEAAKLGLFDRSIAPSFLRGGSVCYAATPDVYIIGADGTIMKCSIDLRENPDNIVGNLEPDGNMVLNENKLKTWNVDLNKNKESCSKCKKWFSCMGNSCPKAYNDGYSASCPDVFEYIHESLKLLMLETEWK